MRWYWEHVKEHIGNKTYGTKWGAIGNMLRNTLGTRKSKNIHRSSPYRLQKEKKIGPLGCMWLKSHWLSRIFMLPFVLYHFFNLGQWQGHKAWGRKEKHPHISCNFNGKFFAFFLKGCRGLVLGKSFSLVKNLYMFFFTHATKLDGKEENFVELGCRGF